MSAPIILTIAFLVFLILGVPVAVSIGLAAIAGMVAAGIPSSYPVQAAYSAVNDFLIIAVPMFVLAGVLRVLSCIMLRQLSARLPRLHAMKLAT